MKTGKRERRGGKDVPRSPKIRPPCQTCPKGPEPFVNELTARNWKAVEYWRLCQADTTGLLPRDLIVLRNNSLCRRIHETQQNHSLQKAVLDVAAMTRIA